LLFVVDIPEKTKISRQAISHPAKILYKFIGSPCEALYKLVKLFPKNSNLGYD